jgi:hypothetical protein
LRQKWDRRRASSLEQHRQLEDQPVVLVE